LNGVKSQRRYRYDRIFSGKRGNKNMKLDKVIPIIEGHGDFDLKATSDFAETVLADKSSNNLELTLAHNLKRAVKHLNFWVGKYSESVEEVSLEDDGAFGKCPACGYEFNSERLSEYDLKFCLNCGKKIGNC
jgi:hypothetical protein